MNDVSRRLGSLAQAALEATACSIVIVDGTKRDFPIMYSNAAFTALCGYTAEESIGRNCRFLQGVDTDPIVVAEIGAAIAAGLPIRREILNYRKDGSPFWNDLTINPIYDAFGNIESFVGVQFGADAVHVARQGLAEAEARLESIANHVPGYIYRRIMRPDGTIDIVYCSPSLSRTLGVSESKIKRSFYKLMHRDDREIFYDAIRKSATNMSIFREEFRLLSSSGETHWFRSDSPPRKMSNGDVVWDGLAIEISSEKRWHGEIADLASHDTLTGLLNRQAWRAAVSERLDGVGSGSKSCGLVCIDIEAFQALNDKLGQLTCDNILKQLAKRLTVLAESVRGVAARLGGDEFAILVPRCDNELDLVRFARVTHEALAESLPEGDISVAIHTRIGVALQAADLGPVDDPVGELLTQAELALRWAKQSTAAGPVLYSRAQDDRFRNQAILERSLERAIEDGELTLHFQPLVDLASGSIVSAEALVRWNHPTLGMQRPDLFIPLAEKSGLIVPLGIWVLRAAIMQRELWQAAGLTPPKIAINVSGKQLTDPNFVTGVRDVLARTCARADNYEIELTEGALIEASRPVMTALHALKKMGFTITIDDFGSGYSTFRYLRDFPVDKVKIDQMFVRKLVVGSSDALIIRAVISLARGMGIAFVAEGIETPLQREFLLREGCEIGQGYFFSLPVVAEDFGWFLANDVKLPLSPNPPAGPGMSMQVAKDKMFDE